jgi:predicted DNA-binding protein with PD1-like motif
VGDVEGAWIGQGGSVVKSYRFDVQGVVLGRLERGDDVLQGLTDFCRGSGIEVGFIEALGALEKGGVGFYDHEARVYREIRFDEGMEIASLVGNISRKDGEAFLHCHAILADRDGRCFGGHLLEGNVAFACEFRITILEGVVPERSFDEATGLALW